LGQYDPDFLPLRASVILNFRPFGPVSSCLSGPSGQLDPDFMGLFGQFGSDLLALRFGPDVLALRASLFLTCWPFGPVWTCCTGASGQFGPDLLDLRASVVLTDWPFGPVYARLLIELEVEIETRNYNWFRGNPRSPKVKNRETRGIECNHFWKQIFSRRF